LSKYQKLTVVFLLLCTASLMLGQIGKTTFTDAPLFGWILGFAFSIFATFTAIKANAVKSVEELLKLKKRITHENKKEGNSNGNF